MSGERLNRVNAAVFSLVGSLLPFLVVVGVLSWTSETIAGAQLVVQNVLVLVGLLWAQSEATNTGPPPAV